MALSRVGTEGVSDASIKAADLNADVITGMAAASPAAAADDDVILVYDTSASALKKMTRGNFKSPGVITALNNATANELVTVGATTTELDAESLLTFDQTYLGLSGGSGMGVISTPSHCFINIDSDADQTDAYFAIGKDRTGTSGGTELMRVQEDGKVGIGVTPTAQLEVYNSASSFGLLKLRSGGGAGAMAGINFSANATASREKAAIYFLETLGGAHYTGDLVFAVNNTNNSGAVWTTDERFRIKSDGDVNVKTGDIVFGTAGKGICLGVTSNTDANTLDDYEEGSFTATLLGTSGNPSSSQTTTGYYTKIGDLVYVSINMNGKDTSGAAGMPHIGGIPFMALGNPGGFPGGNVMFTGGGFSHSGQATPYVVNSSISFYQSHSGGNWSGVLYTNTGTGKTIFVTCHYKSQV